MCNFLFIFLVVNLKASFKPMDGQVVVKKVPSKPPKRTKKCNSKFLNRLFFCLDNRRHCHMLHYCNPKKMEFEVYLKNKKNRGWTEHDISLFIELDSVFKRKRSKKKYAEEVKGRFKSNMRKCANYIREVSTEKLDTSLTVKKYQILQRPQNTVMPTLNEKRESEEHSQNQDYNATANGSDKVENLNTKFEQQKNETVSHFSCLSPLKRKILTSGNDVHIDTAESKFQENIIVESVEDVQINRNDRCIDVKENTFKRNEIGGIDDDFQCVLIYKIAGRHMHEGHRNFENEIQKNVIDESFKDVLMYENAGRQMDEGHRDFENEIQKNLINEGDFENEIQKNLINEGFEDDNADNYFTDVQSIDVDNLFNFNEDENEYYLHDCDDGKLEAQASKDWEMETVTDVYGNTKAQIDVNGFLNGDPNLWSEDCLCSMDGIFLI